MKLLFFSVKIGYASMVLPASGTWIESSFLGTSMGVPSTKVEFLLLLFVCFFPPLIISIMFMSWMFGLQYKKVIVKLSIFSERGEFLSRMLEK